MPRLASRPAPLAPAAPLHAYAEDVARLAGRSPIGQSDDVWLVVAHTLDRAASLDVAERAAVLLSGADATDAVVAEVVAPRAAVDDGAARTLRSGAAAARALRTAAWLLAGRATTGFDATLGSALAALQEIVAEEEQAGAFALAFSTLAALRGALAPALDARGAGLLLAQQGRTARQLGALDAARDLYHAAVREARAAGAQDVAARALLGLGVLYSMRGNYPEAREHFRHALQAGRHASAGELVRASHHGLLVAALAARDVDTALVHGWAAFEGTPTDASAERAEMLINLADAVRQAGEPRAALGACLRALEMTDLARLRLPALGTGALAAAAVGERRLVAHLARDVDRVLVRSGQPFESARALLEVAEALLALDEPEAVEYAARAGALAEAGAFHEIALRAQQVADTVARAADAPRGDAGTAPAAGALRSRRAQSVVRRMEMMATRAGPLAVVT